MSKASRGAEDDRVVEPGRVATGPTQPTSEVLRKPVHTLAIVPRNARITVLGRKAYNVMLHKAQDQGLEQEKYRIPLSTILTGIGYDSHDYALVKKYLRAMVTTSVEWQTPTSGEGTDWDVSALLAHARLFKVRGEVWVEWSYATNLKQELLSPAVFARLKLEINLQLRTHPGLALYEICNRYRDIGRTARQAWRWWHPVLTGQPVTERMQLLEYRIFKRDTLKPAIAEVNALSDIEVDLVEHKEGRFVGEIQFMVRPKRQLSLPSALPPDPVDVTLVARAQSLGINEERVEQLVDEFGLAAFSAGLQGLQARMTSGYPGPVRDPYRYLRATLQGLPDVDAAPEGKGKDVEEGAATGSASADQGKRHARWAEEWLRRRRASIHAEIEALPPEQLLTLIEELHEDMVRRDVHPSKLKRLKSSGWRHSLVQEEMTHFYATRAYGQEWDQPSASQLLGIAGELGDA